MTGLFTTPTDDQLKLMEKRDKLIDEQEKLKIHHYRPEGTELTDDDRKYDELQSQIDAINAELENS